MGLARPQLFKVQEMQSKPQLAFKDLELERSKNTNKKKLKT